ncbi:MAG: 16S rRNA (cytosine(967)-C(5))-methyltransferase RsmB [Desulfosarcina sp.]|nr:16S rRNA (cytosine(967)-C(5))-methyltransferase RsmB [Desulfosarcina sp.]MBC2745111.1 16S rRNA (cytosine(967)-C(5))-methyltransferase RsmB [Desulfosarcina sp.]MBC2768018.1 16S rRNA (cytosine(967)-C(5))-methyltransferase RsmB [Desulfosarcina sp.]
MAASKPQSPTRTQTRQNLPITGPRAGALKVLNRLDRNKKTLDAVLDDAAPMIMGLSRRDRALLNQLVYGVLRWRLRLDAVVDVYANRPLKRIDPPILNILRIGLFQVLFMDRIPASAAVNTAVNLARTQKTSKAAGFVNALLRNALRDPDRFSLPDAVDSPVDHMAIAKSFPHWLVSRWIDRIGVAETERLCDAMNTIPPITLRCNQLKNSLSELVNALTVEAERIDIVEDVAGGVNLIRPRCPIPEMKAFVEGRFTVQDGAAQLVSLLLAPQPGETVLDACAGLGGKTTHLAQVMMNQGTIVAMDNSPAKLARLEKEAHRLGVPIIRTRCVDLNRPPESETLPRFDRILLDAPCSGLGVLRRNPDAKWSSQKKDIARFARRQARFLDHLAPLVKRDGVLVFAVCSMEPEENEQVIKRFLKNHPNFAITGQQSIEEKAVLPFLGENGFLRTAPHIHHMDGFFAARLNRLC